MEKIWLKSYAPGVPTEFDFEPIALHKALKATAQRFPDRPALNFMGKLITYSELQDLTERFSAGLASLGVGQGSKVALVTPNLVQTVVAIYAALRLGAVAIPNNPLYTDRELTHQLQDSGSEYVVAWDTLVPRMLSLREKTGVRGVIICHLRDFLPFPLRQLFPYVKRDLHLKIPKQSGVHEFMDLLKQSGPTPPEHDSHPDDTAICLYTGGTTGVSKGVELTHGNLSANCRQLRAWCPGFRDGAEVILGCLPLFHSYGLTAVMNMSTFHGWCNVLIPKPEPKPILQAVEKYKITLIPGVPTLFNAIIHSPDVKRSGLQSVKGCFSAAAPLPLETIRGFRDLTGITISEAYGLTESSPCTHAIPLGGQEKPGCIGLPMPGTDAKLVDIDDFTREITDLNTPGELCVKGPQVMKGYVNRPDETALTLRDGWLLTGDIATVDEDGYFTVVDRKKDMIISSGFNIYPREVDEVLFECPKIREACAVGVPDAKSGERIKAFVVLETGVQATEEEIVDHCRKRLARYKVPKYVEFVDELPKSAVGKVLRKNLRSDIGNGPNA